MSEPTTFGLNHDKMNRELLVWKGVSFWGLRAKRFDDQYLMFEVYSTPLNNEQQLDFVTYKLSMSHPKYTHSSGWDLQIIKFGEDEPYMKLSECKILKNANFEELFAVVAVLVDEKKNIDIFSDSITKSELKRIRTKWKNWMKDIPDWLLPTIEITRQRQIID